MADPFSVAGSAVGVASLGIQTCQALFHYYSDFKGLHDDIDDVLRRIEGLQDIFDILKVMKGRFETDNHEPSSQLHLALKACEEALHRLKKLADECNATVGSGSPRERLRYARKRAAWPFKKQTVKELQVTLNGFQDNLSLALQWAGLNGVVQRIEDLRLALDTLRDKTTGIEQHLVHHRSTLHPLESNITSNFMHQEQSDITILRELQNFHNEFSRHKTVLEQGLNVLMLSDGQSRNPGLVLLPELAEASQTLQEATPRFQSSLQGYQTQIARITSKANHGSLQPLCHCRQKTEKSTRRTAWVTWSSEEVYEHQPECPRFSHGNYCRSAAAQFMIYSRLVGLYVQVGWQCSRNRGWNAIAPTLRYRAVVSNDAPPFKLLDDACKEVLSGNGRRDTRVALTNTLSGFQAILGKSASPTDFDQKGRGIADAAMGLLSLLVKYGTLDEDAMLTFIDTLIAQGVPLEGMAYWFCIVDVTHLKDNRMRSMHFNITRHIVRKLSRWEVCNKWLHPYYFSEIADLLAVEEFNDGFDEDDDVLRAILRRSSTEFHYQITTDKAIKSKLLLVDYVHALALWTDGLKILISSGIYDANEKLGITLWKEAVRELYLPSIDLLLQRHIRVRLADWNTLNLLIYLRRPIMDSDTHRKVLSTIAARLLPHTDEHPENSPRIEENESRTAPMERTLYHIPHLSVYTAEIAWGEGHRKIDEAKHLATNWGERFGTPLWEHTAYSENSVQDVCSLSQWFLEKGADPFWTNPTLLTTPTHCMIPSFMKLAAFKNSLKPLNEVQSYIIAKQTDKCTCCCSREGCYVIGCAVSRYWYSGRFPKRRYLGWGNRRKLIRPYLFALVDENRDSAWMSSAIIRRLIFEKLGLTHTCCYRVNDESRGRFKRPTPEEAKDVYEFERDEIKLLDDLVLEFECAWAAYTKSFAVFVRKVWKPRMREVLRGVQVDKEEYQAELRRMGVVIDKSKEGDGSESESESDVSKESEESEGSGWYTTDDEDGVGNTHTGSEDDEGRTDEDGNDGSD